MQNINTLLFISIIITSFFCSAHEFVYPVGYCAQKKMLFYQYQQSPTELSLFAYDSKTKEHIKLLSSFFTPVGFRLLPDQTGFSFIQNDSLYVKYFNKRSPKRIEFYEPIYGINTIEWIDNNSFYFAAREHGKYKIYQSNLEGDVDCIMQNETLNIMYPQKVDNSIFYIVRDERNNYSIMHNPIDNPKQLAILCTLSSALACLHMISDERGFFLSYGQQIKKESELLNFEYYQLVLSDSKWKTQLLFTFSLPLDFFSNQSSYRVYESIIPFLPRYDDNNQVYFVDYETNKNSTLKVYKLREKTVTKVQKPIILPTMPGIFIKEDFNKILEYSSY